METLAGGGRCALVAAVPRIGNQLVGGGAGRAHLMPAL